MALTRLLMILAASVAALPACTQSLLAVPQVDTPPAIDGNPSPGEWSAAGTTCGFRDNVSGLPAQAPVTVLVCYDERALYCLFAAHGEPPEELKGEGGDRDSAIWSGSLVELFIAPPNWPVSKYGHLMLHHTDTVADELANEHGRDLSWDPDWQHATSKGEDVWFAEMAVPWAALGIDEPREGSAVRVNFARNAAGVDELSTWAPVLGGFHHPEQFGKLVLAGRGPVAQIAKLPSRATGPATISARLLGVSGRLIATLATGEAGEAKVFGSRFQAGDEALKASVELRIPGGARELDIQVNTRSESVVWRQTLRLDLPDLVEDIGGVREELARIERSATGIAQSELTGLREDLDTLQAKAAEPQDAVGLAAMTEAIQRIHRRATDLSRLKQSATLTRGSKALPYFVTNPVTTQKIQPTEADPGPLASRLRIAMCRGEYEPVQIAVCAVSRDLERVRVTAGKLRGPGGELIPSERVAVNPLGFVRCKHVTGGAPLMGEMPDVLLPNRRVSVAAGRRQPFFITVQTTPDDVPGEYHGYVRVRAEGEPSVRLPLTVRVYDLTLPVQSHLRTAFVLWGRFRNWMGEHTNEEYVDKYIEYSRLMLAHRISPITMWRATKDEQGEWDFTDFDRYLSAVVPLGVTTVNLGGNGYVTRERNTSFTTAAAAHFKERGWWDLHYLYGHDEASRNLLDKLKADYSALVEAVPDVRIMQTGWSPHPELKGAVSIWCPLTAGANMGTVRQAQAEGDEVWWYVCCGPLAPYANLFVDYPGIDHRMLGWQTYQQGIEGFLYWGVDVWTHNSLPLEEYDSADYANWNPNSFATINGDGYLLYPGPGNAPMASMRLALLRDGFEDYDLFMEAEALATGTGSAARALRGMLTLDDISPSLTDYEQDGRVLLDRREQILQACEELAAGRG